MPVILSNVSKTNALIRSIPKSEVSNKRKFNERKIASLKANDFVFVMADKSTPAPERKTPAILKPCNAAVSITTIDRPSVADKFSELVGSLIAACSTQNHAPINSAIEASRRRNGGMSFVFPED